MHEARPPQLNDIRYAFHNWEYEADFAWERRVTVSAQTVDLPHPCRACKRIAYHHIIITINDNITTMTLYQHINMATSTSFSS